ncbi:DUF2252 family protein [Cohnella nanjingensis]|uniref:DUF2252 family protein n=1 Tax=Cohnella nanjingensis TaxID=1387779 RepID=A0A7X0RT10_9BACL|nr:DUF2252 family protein [Cohnella nanjingensis]MBB6671941.1 DUF2252 family protein [Cohnella nanjingensis]
MLRKRTWRRQAIAAVLGVLLVLNPLLGELLPGTGTKAAAAATGAQNADHIVISQIYAGGTDNFSKGPSIYSHDYVELYNPTDADVTLTNWSVQYAVYDSADGTDWNVAPLGTDPSKSTIKAHGFYLVKLGTKKAAEAADPTKFVKALTDSFADAVAPAGFPHLNKDGGKIALVQTTGKLTAQKPAAIDFVGYGASNAANAYEGTGVAPDGSYQKGLVRKGVDAGGAVVGATDTFVPGNGNGYDTDDNMNDFVQVKSVFVARNSTMREPAIQGAADAGANTVIMASDTGVSPGQSFKINLSVGHVRTGELTSGADYVLSGLPAGLNATATGADDGKSITFAVGGTAESPVTADAALQAVVKGAALSPANAYPDSGTIGGIQLIHASAHPQVTGIAVPGATQAAMKNALEIDPAQAVFAVQLTGSSIVRSVSEADPLTAGTDYTVAGLPAGLALQASADAGANRIVFAIAGRADSPVLNDLGLTVIIKGAAVQAVGATDSEVIAGFTLLRAHAPVDASQTRKAYVEQQIVQDNRFFNDPVTKAYKYGADGLAGNVFTFFRGTNALYEADLQTGVLPLPQALRAYDGIQSYVQGDAHIQNVGFFNDSKGEAVFDLNDPDSSGVGHFYDDLLRFATSIYLAKYDSSGTALANAPDGDFRWAAKQFMEAYKNTVLGIHSGAIDETAYKLTSDRLSAYTKSAMNKVTSKAGPTLAAARTAQVTKWNSDINKAGSTKYQAATAAELVELSSHWNSYLQNIRADSTLNDADFDRFFTVKKTVRRINQGIGSMGVLRYNVLIEGPTSSDADDILLDVKEQRQDANKSKQAYQALSIDTDPYLGVLTGSDRTYLIREISPYKGDYTDSTFTGSGNLGEYAADAGTAYALAHARSDNDAPEGGLQSSFEDAFATDVAPNWDTLSTLMLNAAEDYAHQAVQDYALVVADMKAGKLIDVATLDRLSVSQGKLSPDFSPSQLNYTVNVEHDVDTLEIQAAATDSLSPVTVNGDSYTSGQPKSMALKAGDNAITVIVTAQDGTTTKNYNVTATRAAASDPTPSPSSTPTPTPTPSPSPSPSTSPSQPSTPQPTPAATPTPAPDAGTIVQIPGGVALTAKAIATKEQQDADGQPVRISTIAAEALKDALTRLSGSGLANPILQVTLQPDQAKPLELQLPASSLTGSAAPAGTVLQVGSGFAGYRLPLSSIPYAELAANLGTSLSDMTVSIRLVQAAYPEAPAAKNALQQAGYAPIGDPVTFAVMATAKSGKRVEVSDFGGAYVPRTIAYTGTIEPSRMLAVRIEKDGTVTIVPATFNQGQAVIFSPGNSTFALVQAKSKTFSDLTAYWAKPEIELLATKGIMNGTSATAFSPRASTTRAEFAALLSRAMALRAPASPAAFTDVTATAWYADVIGAAHQAGLIDGFTDDTYQPNAPITREQIAVLIGRAAKLAGKPLTAGQSAQPFKDQALIGAWAREAVMAAQAAGIVQGHTDNTFAPAQAVTRAEAAVMLSRLLKAVGFMNG